jgi:hypothetical protein
MSSFQPNNSLLISVTENVVESNVQQNQGHSRETLGHLNLATANLANAQASIAMDIARNPNMSPEDMLGRLQQMQEIQKQAASMRDTVSQNVSPNFAPNDVGFIRDLKAQNMSEKNIAAVLETNQTRINRLLNENK